MKYLIASDSHGSVYDLKYLKDAAKERKADKVVLLGDLYNTGNVREVNALLLTFSCPVISVEGNCDLDTAVAQSDGLFLGRTMTEQWGGRLLFFSHGNIYNRAMMPGIVGAGDILFCGHTHIAHLSKEKGVIIANPGSLGYPRGNSTRCFLELTEKSITLHELYSGEEIGRYLLTE